MDITQIAGPLILFLLMTIVGLELTLADFGRVLASPRAVVGGTLGQWVLLPVMTWGVVVAFELTPAFGAGAVLVAVSPGAGMSNVVVALARANVALSVTLTATASVFAAIILPPIASSMMGLFVDGTASIEVPVQRLIIQLLLTLLAPIAFGMWMRRHHPDRADRLGPVLMRVTLAVIVVVVAAGIATAPEEQRNMEGGARALAAAGVWTLLAGLMGWGVGALLRLSAEDRFTFAVEFAARNIAVSAIVAMSGLERLDLTFFSGAYAMVGYPLVVTAVLIRRRLVTTHGAATETIQPGD